MLFLFQKKSQKRIEEIIKHKQEELDAELKMIEDRKIDIEAPHNDYEDTFDDQHNNTTTTGHDIDAVIVKRKPIQNGKGAEDSTVMKSVVVAPNRSGNKNGKANGNPMNDDVDDHEQMLIEAAELADDVHLIDDDTGLVNENSKNIDSDEKFPESGIDESSFVNDENDATIPDDKSKAEEVSIADETPIEVNILDENNDSKLATSPSCEKQDDNLAAQKILV